MLSVTIRHKRYDTADGRGVEALRDFAFEAPAGSFTVLFGPSGCGKSTALRIMLGLDADYDGTVALPGARVGVMFQEPRLLPWRTLADNVRLALPAALASRDLAPLFAELDLTDMASRYPGELSGGLARRAALARALAIEPDVLILDEPFVSLDALTAARLRGLLAATVARRSVTTVMVTHDIREAIELADRLIVMTPRPGRVLGVETFDPPRGPARDSGWSEARLADLAQRYPGTIHGG
jgi:NitT/TauT family transport system ATP-binding protein